MKEIEFSQSLSHTKKLFQEHHCHCVLSHIQINTPEQSDFKLLTLKILLKKYQAMFYTN